MKLLDDNILTEFTDDVEASGESAEDNTDFLDSLEKKAEEVKDEPDNFE